MDFESVKNGDVFLYERNTYMSIQEITDNNGMEFNCINLENGALDSLYPYDIVEVLRNVELTYEKE